MLKVVFFYTQSTRGWTETYYAPGSSPSTWVQANQAQLNNPFNFMAGRADDVILTSIRVSAIGFPRTVYTIPLNYPSPNSLGANAEDYTQDTIGVDALLLMRSNAGINRHLWLRGIPESYVIYDLDGNPTPPAEFLNRIALFQSGVLTLGFQIQNAVLPAPSSLSWFPVASVEASATAPTAASVLNCQTVPVMTQPYGPLYFQGIPKNELPGFPRIVSPTVITNPAPPALGAVVVPYKYRGNQTLTGVTKMKFCVLTYTYNVITSLTFLSYSTRKTGRPTNLPRGRVSVAIRRQ